MNTMGAASMGSGVKRQGLLRPARLLLPLLLLAAVTADADEAQWQVTTQNNNNKVSGLAYELSDEAFIHTFLILRVPDEEEKTKLVYSMRLKSDMSKPQFREGAVTFSTQKGEDTVSNYHTKAMHDHKEYTSCVQVVEGEVFDAALHQRLGKLFESMQAKSFDRSLPQSVALLDRDEDFKALQSEVLGQVNRLRPVAELLYDSFAFGDCEKGKNMLLQLERSKQVKHFVMDRALEREHDQSLDLVNPAYLSDYIVQSSKKLCKGDHYFDLDLMGGGTIMMRSIKNKVHYLGKEPVVLADSMQCQEIPADIFVVEMVLPIVSWFMDVKILFGVNSGKIGPDLVLSEYPGSENIRYVTWPLKKIVLEKNSAEAEKLCN